MPSIRSNLAVAVLLSLALAGCELRKKNAVSTPPSPKPSAPAAKPPATVADEPLSIPQTRVQLPPRQPISPEALASIPPQPVLETPPNIPPQISPRRASAAPVPIAPPPQPTKESKPAEPERPAIETMLSEDARRQLINEIEGRLKKTQEILSQLHPRRLSAEQRDVVARAHSFVKLSNEALKRGDTTQAGELADRALLLAGDLARGR